MRSFGLAVLLSAALAAASARHGDQVQVAQRVLALAPFARVPAGLTRGISLCTSVLFTCVPPLARGRRRKPSRAASPKTVPRMRVRTEAVSLARPSAICSCAHPRDDMPRQQPAIDIDGWQCYVTGLPALSLLDATFFNAPAHPHLMYLLILARPWPAPVHARSVASNVRLRGPGNYLQLLMHVIWLLEHRHQV